MNDEPQIVADEPRKPRLQFRGVHQQILDDTTRAVCAEGALNSGKSICCLWKEATFLDQHPGIWTLIARWTQDAVDTLLKPEFERVCRLYGIEYEWQAKEKYYLMQNGSHCYAYGLQTLSTDAVQRYSKIRGLPVSRIYIDQAEQLPDDIAAELVMRLRPDIETQARGIEFPRQITFSPNPTNDDSWLAKNFPEGNTIKGRKYYRLSLYDNLHVLPKETLDDALLTYPPDHPKHETMILGKRGPNVIGPPVYENLFNRSMHVHDVRPDYALPLIEAFQVGEHNPTWVIGQRSYYGGILLLGGIIGKKMILDDFVPFVQRHRREWFPDATKIKTCIAPTGGKPTTTASRYTLVTILREAGIQPIFQENANAPDVQIALIEQISAMLRHRVRATEEALQVSDDKEHWLNVSPDGTVKQKPFVCFAFDGGYVWSKHTVSVSHADIRQPEDDDEYSNAMRCVENLILNFCSGQQTQDEIDEKRAKQRLSSGGGLQMPYSGRNGWMAG